MGDFGSGGNKGGGKKSGGKGIDPNASTWANWQAQGLPIGGELFRKAVGGGGRIQDAGWVVPRIQRHLALHPEPAGGYGVQRKESGGGEAAGGVKIPEGGGAKLPGGVQAKMQQKLGADLSDVKIHTGGESAQASKDLNARAFTQGADVHFAAGEFDPSSKDGEKLLAHELTHVAQNKRGGGVQRKEESEGEEVESAEGEQLEVSDPDEPAEKEADAKADEIVDGGDTGPVEEQGAAVGTKLHRVAGAGAGGTPETRWASDLGNMLPEGKTYALTKISSAPAPVQAGAFAGFRTHLESQTGIQQIMGGTTTFGPKVRKEAVTGAQKVVEALAEGGAEGINLADDAKKIVDLSAPKVHAKQAPYSALHAALVTYVFTKASPVAAAEGAYNYDVSPETKTVTDKIPADDDALVTEYDTLVVPKQTAGTIAGNATGIRNQFLGAIKGRQYAFASGFKTQMQQVLKAAKALDADQYPQLSGVEVSVAGKRVDYTCYENKADKDKKLDVAYEVKNWNSFATKTPTAKIEIISHFVTQTNAYLSSKGGLVLQVKGTIPGEAQGQIASLQARATAANKVFRVEPI